MLKENAAEEQSTSAATPDLFVEELNTTIADLAMALQGYAERDPHILQPVNNVLGVHAQQAKFDALFELLVSKGVITREEYNQTTLAGYKVHAEGLREETRKLAHRPIIAVKAASRRQ